MNNIIHPSSNRGLISFVVPTKRDKRLLSCIHNLHRYIQTNCLCAEVILCGDCRDVKLPCCNVRKIETLPAYKGRCVRQGVLYSKGDFIVVIDADFPVRFQDITSILESLSHFDISLGNRYLGNSRILIKTPIFRRMISRISKLLISACLEDNSFDTQCGFKAFNRLPAFQLFEQQVGISLIYEVEIVLRALSQKMKITQSPVHWQSQPGSTINFWTSLPLSFIELFCLWKKYKSSSKFLQNRSRSHIYD